MGLDHHHVQMWTGSRAAALDWGHCRPAPGHDAQGCHRLVAVGIRRFVKTGRRFGVGTFYCSSHTVDGCRRTPAVDGGEARFAGTRGDKRPAPHSLRNVQLLPRVARAGRMRAFGLRVRSRAYSKPLEHARQSQAQGLPRLHRSISAAAGFDDQHHAAKGLVDGQIIVGEIRNV